MADLAVDGGAAGEAVDQACGQQGGVVVGHILVAHGHPLAIEREGFGQRVRGSDVPEVAARFDGVAVVVAAQQAATNLGVAQLHITAQPEPFVGLAAAVEVAKNHIGRAGEGTAVLLVIGQRDTPAGGVVFAQQRPLAAGLAVCAFTGAVGTDRAGAGIHRVAPEAVLRAQLQAPKCAPVGQCVVGTGVGDVGVKGANGVNRWADHVGIHHRPEQHGVLATSCHGAPGPGQPYKGLAAKQAAALCRRTHVGRKTHFCCEHGAQAVAQVFIAPKAHPRWHRTRVAGHTLDRAFVCHVADNLHPRVDQPIQRDAGRRRGRLGIRANSAGAGQGECPRAQRGGFHTLSPGGG